MPRLWNQPRCPSIFEWIKKLWYIYTVEYYSALRKNKIVAFAGKRMELEYIILSEISQAPKPKGQMFSLLNEWWYIMGDKRKRRNWNCVEVNGVGGDGRRRQTLLSFVHALLHEWCESMLRTIIELKSCTPFVYN